MRLRKMTLAAPHGRDEDTRNRSQEVLGGRNADTQKRERALNPGLLDCSEVELPDW